jgi:hypothetical protein
MRAKELQDAGAKGLPRVIRKFVARVTDPDKAPIAWDEARDFYSNVSRLSANEYQSMNPQMAGQVAKFAGAFNDALRATAEAARPCSSIALQKCGSDLVPISGKDSKERFPTREQEQSAAQPEGAYLRYWKGNEPSNASHPG